VALLSGRPLRRSDLDLLTNDQIGRAGRPINKTANSRRMLPTACFTAKKAMDGEVDRADRHAEADSWRLTIGDPLFPSKLGTYWRLGTTRKLMYPFYEKRSRRINTICIHKGLLPADYESWPDVWKYATARDLPKAAKDWPKLNFVIYHGRAARVSRSPGRRERVDKNRPHPVGPPTSPRFRGSTA